MIQSLQLLFGTVNSIPLGMSHDEIEHVYQNRLRPFIKALYRYPRLKATLYYSGILLDWIEKYHSEFLDVLTEMIKRRQVELLGGGFYEPIFSLISKTDSIGQIEFLTTYLRRTFGGRPRGCWIPEMVWEPNYPSIFRSAGMEYTFLGEEQFLEAGYEEKDLYSPTLTEDQGKILTIFPIAERLSRRILSDTPEKIFENLQTIHPGYVSFTAEPIISLLWDGTGVTNCLGEQDVEQWLEEFFALLQEKQLKGIIHTRQPQRLSRVSEFRSRVYFPPTSYICVLRHLGLSKKTIDQFLDLPMPGVGRMGLFYRGMFRQALTRYPEGCLLYGKMQFVNSLVNQVRGDRYRKQAAKEELWKGQTHNPFWHGPKGGIYCNGYRKSAYKALISSELLTREQGIFAPSITTTDLDMDGLEEYLYQGNDLNAYVHSQGGALFELDYLPNPWNYQDTFARYPEPYHNNGENSEFYDLTPRNSFIDHFFSPTQPFDPGQHPAERGTLCNQLYTVQDRTTEVAKTLHLDLVAEGLVESDEGIQTAVEIAKRYSFEKSKVTVQYRVRNNGSELLQTLFAPELNLSFSGIEVSDLRMYRLEGPNARIEMGQTPQHHFAIQGIHFEDVQNKVNIRIETDTQTNAWSWPVYTQHPWNNETVTTYQHSCLLFAFPLELNAGDEKQLTFTLRLTKLR